jgi:Planctomycete cytochrome C
MNIQLFCLSTVVIVLTCCTRESVDDEREVCFERDVLPIFQSSCTQSSCHNSTDLQQGYDLSSFAGIVQKGIKPGDYKNSKIYEVLIKPGGEEAMPPKPYNRLTDEQIATIALWIEDGAKSTTCNSNTGCDTANVTFSGSIKPILQTYCINFSTYSGVKANATNGKLLGSIRHDAGFSPMPQNGNKLSTCNIALIKAWIDAGAPNN